MTIINEKLTLVIAGHVDHGKSTIIGRMLADTHSLPEGKLEMLKEYCDRNSKPFEYAFLLDALKDEQSQGITIDSARVFFKTQKRDYVILDAPGHIEFLKNMITGAANAEAALLVIDANEGIQENSKRHAYMLSMLGIKQITVLVNKMDLVEYSQKKFEILKRDFSNHLSKIGLEVNTFIPVSGMEGENIASSSHKMEWFKGKTVLEELDSLKKSDSLVEKKFRMPVQDIYKFTKFGDNRRIIAGNVLSGKLAIGDEILFLPSGKKSRVKTIEAFESPKLVEAKANESVGITLEEQLYITRGELAVKKNEAPPTMSKLFKASVFWLGKTPFVKNREYLLKIGTTKHTVKLLKIEKLIDASSLKSKDNCEKIERHDVAEVVLESTKPVVFDTNTENLITSRFVIIDSYEIRGGGIITSSVDDNEKWLREKVIKRQYKWEKSNIPTEDRARLHNQKPTIIFVTGNKDTGKKKIARTLEKELFEEGRLVYFMGIVNLLYGVDADITGVKDDHNEHIRRLSEVANILLDSGMIVIITAVELTKEDISLIKTGANRNNFEVIWLGEKITTDIKVDRHFPIISDEKELIKHIKIDLSNKGIIPLI